MDRLKRLREMATTRKIAEFITAYQPKFSEYYDEEEREREIYRLFGGSENGRKEGEQ